MHPFSSYKPFIQFSSFDKHYTEACPLHHLPFPKKYVPVFTKKAPKPNRMLHHLPSQKQGFEGKQERYPQPPKSKHTHYWPSGSSRYCGSRSRVLRQTPQAEVVWPLCPHQSCLISKPDVKLTEDKTFVVIVDINKHQVKPAMKRIHDWCGQGQAWWKAAAPCSAGSRLQCSGIVHKTGMIVSALSWTILNEHFLFLIKKSRAARNTT